LRVAVLGNEPWSLHVTDGWPDPSPGPGQLVVRVRGVGICGSDLALLSGARRSPAHPWVPGHEAFGEVSAAGASADHGRVGQRVVIEPNYPCLRCRACRTGLTSRCQDRAVVGFTAPGMLAEYVTVPARFAWPVPDAWSDDDAVCAEPLAVALAAIRRSGIEPGSRCLVVGAGAQGTLLSMALVSRGITPYLLEPDEARRRLAASLGAEPAGPGDTGFDTVFETAGAEAAVGEAISRAAHGASIVLIGLAKPATRVDMELVVRRQLALRGSLIYDHPGDFAAMLASAALSPGRVLRTRYPLAQAEQAFRAAPRTAGKTWISVPD
jgi:2-desacetyl-2-hydroxyethyl bacteriochlorophyllide A dehydrogenase